MKIIFMVVCFIAAFIATFIATLGTQHQLVSCQDEVVELKIQHRQEICQTACRHSCTLCEEEEVVECTDTSIQCECGECDMSVYDYECIFTQCRKEFCEKAEGVGGWNVEDDEDGLN